MSEFSRLIAQDAIGRTGPLVLTADAAERAAVAARLGLVSLESLSVAATVEPIAGGAQLSGSLDAHLVQSCAATDLPIETQLSAPFMLRYISAPHIPDATEAEAEIELSDDDLDTLPLEPGGIDVGEAAVQTLALALDPYPRHADADQILKAGGVLSEDQAGPFAALAALRAK